MEIRDLGPGDLEQLEDLIKEIYSERPSAMWFESPPDSYAIRKLFDYKLKGIGEGRIVDVVAETGSALLGECEIVNLPGGMGYVGLLVRKGSRLQGLGRSLLLAASKSAKALGTTLLRSDVTEDNGAAVEFFRKNGFNESGPARRSVTINGKAYLVTTLEKQI